jgi:probable F420-dependent oxidoreductase
VKLGVILPQIEMGSDPQHLVRFARTAEDCGFSYVVAYDHVLGADTATRPDWTATYTTDTPFHESFVLFGFLAAHTSSLELMTGVVALPQRQTALVAKQSAEIDLLTRGRFRLGVGIGWNDVEFRALGAEFKSRAARFEEQIDVLRRLWTERSVTFEARFHSIDRAGILPRPVQQPIPIWIGAGTYAAPPPPAALDRIGRLADGWICSKRLGPDVEAAWGEIQSAASRAGRARDAIGLQCTIQPGGDRQSGKVTGTGMMSDAEMVDVLQREATQWERFGVTHLSVSGLGVGRDPDEHIRFVEVAAKALLH